MRWRWRLEGEVFVLRGEPLPPGLAELGFVARTLRGDRPSAPPDTVRLDQIHGTRVAWAARPDVLKGCDAVRSASPGLLLTVRTADCLPAVLASPEEGIAALHAGWRGLSRGIVEATVATFRRPDAVQAVLGPTIGACCYEVGPEVAALFPRSLVAPRSPRPRVDLRGEARIRLAAAGVPEESVHDPGVCTKCHQHLLPSHRGSRGHEGRFLTVARCGR